MNRYSLKGRNLSLAKLPKIYNENCECSRPSKLFLNKKGYLTKTCFSYPAFTCNFLRRLSREEVIEIKAHLDDLDDEKISKIKITKKASIQKNIQPKLQFEKVFQKCRATSSYFKKSAARKEQLKKQKFYSLLLYFLYIYIPAKEQYGVVSILLVALFSVSLVLQCLPSSYQVSARSHLSLYMLAIKYLNT